MGQHIPVILLLSGVSLFLLVGLNYLAYFFLVLRNKGIPSYVKRIQTIQHEDHDLYEISIIVPTFEEAEVIRRKLENIAALDYPRERLRVLVVDDCSKDGTAELAETLLRKLQLNGKVIRTSRRIGLNASLNVAFEEVEDPLICITDVDVLLEQDSLKNAVTVLGKFGNAGGATGRLIPVFNRRNVTTESEESYRLFYDQAMLAESSLHSVFPGNGTLVVFKKSSLSRIPESYGSSDGDIVIGVIKGGNRFLYVPNAIVKEIVPDTLGQQRLQKVRRARRLIEVFLHNSDVLFNRQYGKFGRVIFPIKFMMHILSPILLLFGFALVILFAASVQYTMLYGVFILSLVAILGTLVVFSRIRSFVLSFVLHNLYLILGLLSLPRRSHLWKKVERE
jgi:cellulose synthase/poly-beta-1,6-N-acetylglucosamine synthase-like glycosyltransferase